MLLNYNGRFMTNTSEYYLDIYKQDYINNFEVLNDIGYFPLSIQCQFKKKEDLSFYEYSGNILNSLINWNEYTDYCNIDIKKEVNGETSYLRCNKAIDEQYLSSTPDMIQKKDITEEFVDLVFASTSFRKFNSITKFLSKQDKLNPKDYTSSFNLVF